MSYSEARKQIWKSLKFFITISLFKIMKEGLKIYKVDFNGMWSVGNCLVLAAFNQEQAEEIARKTITHTKEMVVNEMTINEPQVIEYLSGDY